MAILNIQADVPDDVVTGIATGLYKLCGTVVRYNTGVNKGQIYMHLPTCDQAIANAAKKIGEEANNALKQNKTQGIAIGVAATLVGIGIGTFAAIKIKNHEPKELTDYRMALRQYVDGLREGNMDIGKIEHLLATIDKLKQHKNYNKISIQLKAEELEVLVARIYQYTINLAKVNDVEITEIDNNYSRENTENIITLQNCLQMQRKVFKEAA